MEDKYLETCHETALERVMRGRTASLGGREVGLYVLWVKNVRERGSKVRK